MRIARPVWTGENYPCGERSWVPNVGSQIRTAHAIITGVSAATPMTITKNCNTAIICVTVLQYCDDLLAMLVLCRIAIRSVLPQARLLIGGALVGADHTPACRCVHHLFARRATRPVQFLTCGLAGSDSA